MSVVQQAVKCETVRWLASVAQLVEFRSYEATVTGSSPVGRILFVCVRDISRELCKKIMIVA